MIVAETPRLILRQLTLDDLDDLAKIYADPVVMKFYPSTRTYEETKQQVERIIGAYKQRGFGLWATIHKADRKFIGRCGLIPQLVDEQQEIEIGYLLAKEYWRRGLATEAACANRDYGFEQLGFSRLISLIDPGNIASQKVAMKVGLTYEKDATMWGKTVRVYAIHKQEIP
ncbi:GNAT family N-acetyltransferase [Chroococcidiopsis sp. CCMEE 29]|uniref:GNAT family N-acetyltransferase n=1 Tax=Chroococcidiopsis sp. CCMEE 29 TaxID=155894 RepID=UPI002021588F|nr:GNAT family N-acetyltransferase [Chroococcidiopsis sp. CCMEE 29]